MEEKLNPENADLETVSLSNHPDFLEIIERSRARQKEEGGIPVRRCAGSLSPSRPIPHAVRRVFRGRLKLIQRRPV
jgi:hypothetical protein